MPFNQMEQLPQTQPELVEQAILAKEIAMVGLTSTTCGLEVVTKMQARSLYFYKYLHAAN